MGRGDGQAPQPFMTGTAVRAGHLLTAHPALLLNKMQGMTGKMNPLAGQQQNDQKERPEGLGME